MVLHGTQRGGPTPYASSGPALVPLRPETKGVLRASSSRSSSKRADSSSDSDSDEEDEDEEEDEEEDGQRRTRTKPSFGSLLD